MFPHVSQDAIIQDLQVTHSVEATADNILEGVIPANEVSSKTAGFLCLKERKVLSINFYVFVGEFDQENCNVLITFLNVNNFSYKN